VITPFQPDLFSRSGPEWTVADPETAVLVESLLEGLGDDSFRLASPPERLQGLEINSRNFRLTTRNGRFLLKRWSEAAESSAIERTLELMEWLGSHQLPVPIPLRLGERLVNHCGSRWTLFPFIEGSWFAGRPEELEATAEISGRLSVVLSRIPHRLHPGVGPDHLSNGDDEVLALMEHERPRWETMFGGEHASLLENCWADLMHQWRRLRDDRPCGGAVQAVHFNLHPHNLLLDGGQVTAVLDFEACTVMPLGYAVAFAGLKQGRQAVVTHGDARAANAIGAPFLRRIIHVCPPLEELTRFADLALAETLRRLSIIFRLNVEKSVTTWNKVLPIQLAHLSESRLLFNS
jgi:Ser/Thr protein kinase RdoA (MazF antagonist)